MGIYSYIFGSVIFVSALSLIGVFFLSLSSELLKKLIFFLVSLSAGALIGDSFLHLLPEAAETSNGRLGIWLWLIGGIIVFFILEKIIHWRHCHVPTGPDHPHPLGMMNLVGDALHNFFDGVVIAGSFLINIPLGLTTLIAVIAHEVPHEIGNFGILVYAGYSRGRALLLNFFTALTALLGALAAVLAGPKINGFADFIIPFTAGGFIYIASADLIPEMKKETGGFKSFLQLLCILAGVGLMLLLKLAFE
ncbi:MAG: ZIP family metal transporter [Patescibacteria group bacterium]|jgi:zinc and cadmium transporter